jgi:hypothetical protein
MGDLYKEIYIESLSRDDFQGQICPFMSGIGPRSYGSAWKGITCIEGKCKAWDRYCNDCKLMIKKRG